MNFETGRRLLLLLQEMQGRAYTPFAPQSHEQPRANLCAGVNTVIGRVMTNVERDRTSIEMPS
jgi:hypothetical protein